MLLLDGFPGEAEADIDRLHHVASAALFGYEHRAVHPAARQNDDPTVAISGDAHSPR